MESLKTSKPKARKKHTCNFCHETINSGEVYDNQTNIYDGELYTWKSHLKCSEISQKLKMYENCDEGVTDNDFYDYINEAFAELPENLQPNSKIDFKEMLNIVCDFHLAETSNK